MPSNFTTRVLQAIEREAATTDRGTARKSAPWWRMLVPRMAVATVVVGVGLIAYRHNQTVKREELVDALVTVAGTAPLSDPSVMEDFEAIRQMSQADDSLLALSDDLMSLKQ